MVDGFEGVESGGGGVVQIGGEGEFMEGINGGMGREGKMREGGGIFGVYIPGRKGWCLVMSEISSSCRGNGGGSHAFFFFLLRLLVCVTSYVVCV